MLICLECSWYGDDNELVAKTDATDDLDFIFCPDCGGKDLQEEDEED